MSTIVFANGVMAADSRAWAGSRMPIGAKKKIHRLEDGSLIGISGSGVGFPDSFLRWVKAQNSPECTDAPENYEIQAILVRPDGSIYYWNDGSCFTGPLQANFVAIGSGELAALGALHMGADAARAVAVASEIDYCTGMGIETLQLRVGAKDDVDA